MRMIRVLSLTVSEIGSPSPLHVYTVLPMIGSSSTQTVVQPMHACAEVC